MNKSNGTSSPQSIGGTEVPFDFTVTTKRFRIGPSAYLSSQLRHKMGLYMSLPLAILFISLLLGIAVDLKWFLAGLMVFFLIMPFLAALVYFSKILTYNAYLALSPKHVIIDKQGNLTIIYEKRDPDNEDEPSPHPPQRFSGSEIIHTHIVGSHLVMEVAGLNHPLLIPADAFTDRYDYHRLCSNYGT